MRAFTGNLPTVMCIQYIYKYVCVFIIGAIIMRVYNQGRILFWQRRDFGRTSFQQILFEESLTALEKIAGEQRKEKEPGESFTRKDGFLQFSLVVYFFPQFLPRFHFPIFLCFSNSHSKHFFRILLYDAHVIKSQSQKREKK